MSSKTTICLYTHGGGMRGLIPALLMQEIEERTGLAMVDMIDIFTGPSTGAILNTALNIPNPEKPDRPKYTAQQMVQFYEREGNRIFPQDRFRSIRGLLHDMNNRLTKIKKLDGVMNKGHYDPANLGRSLRALYRRYRLSDTLGNIIIPVYNIASPSKDKTEDEQSVLDQHAVWLKKLNIPKSPKPPVCSDVSLFDAVMGSTAAPTYFPCHEFSAKINNEDEKTKTVTAIDGSLFDSAAITYMSVLKRYIPEKSKVIMIVLGTGITRISFTKKQWDKFGGFGVVDPAHGSPLINIFFHATESALSSGFKEQIQENLFVFNKSLVPKTKRHNLPDQDIDNASPENIEKLKKFANDIIKENDEELTHLCEILVKHNKKRSKKKRLL